MKIVLPALLVIAFCLSSCSPITRTVEDVYTKVHYDTLTTSETVNQPGVRKGGVVYPASQKVEVKRETLLEDSTVTMRYPNFIRLGFFESIGTLFNGGGGNSCDNGLFGLYSLISDNRNDKSVFSGGIYRFGVGEWRLRWFHDAENWTYGFSGIEMLLPENVEDKRMVGILPFYLRKRWYLSDNIPYRCITLSMGISCLPSPYFNISGSYDIGSIGGLNIRAYAGVAAGIATDNGNSVNYPYLGLGCSVLDFLNKQDETEHVWEEYNHSSWDVGLIQFGFLNTGQKSSAFGSTNSKYVFNGLWIKIVNANVALPFANNKFYIGTSLVSALSCSEKESLFGILPLRFGYFETVLADELSTEPFVELSYYPFTSLSVCNKLNLRLNDLINLSFLVGYSQGSISSGVLKGWSGMLADEVEHVSRFYIGIGVGFLDRLFLPKELRYNRNGLPQ